MNEKNRYIQKQHIDELIAIYQDYLYMSREHEAVLQKKSLGDLAGAYWHDLHSGAPKFVWQTDMLSPDEKRDFTNCIDADEYGENMAYVMLRYIKPQDNNNVHSKQFAMPPYKVISFNMILPSNIEQCTIVYHPEAKLGDVDFLIDGQYKAKYTDDEHSDMPLDDFIHDQKMMNEFTAMITFANLLRQENHITDDKFERLMVNVYAAECVATNENVILELLGTFAEKLLAVCRDIYKLSDMGDVFRRAESDGLIPSADDFCDYVNIRNFMRHQWDIAEDMEFSNAAKSKQNKIARATYAKSYLKLWDKTLIARMKSYIDVLHQMQHVICQIAPERLIRDNSESNNKFIKRVQMAYAQPNAGHPSVELNLPLDDEKYARLHKTLDKLVPGINIADVFPMGHGKEIGIDYYPDRSNFLQEFHTVECMVMRYCVLRGCNLRRHEAWNHIKQLGIISEQECKTWQDYAMLRNQLSHNYFNADLRKQLMDQKTTFHDDAIVLMCKMSIVSPKVKKLRDGVYQYTHPDSLVVHLDVKNHRILNQNGQSIEYLKYALPNGMEIYVYNDMIAKVKLQNGINIDLQNQTINLGDHTMWRAIKGRVNILQTAKSKVYTGPDLRVTKCTEGDRNIPFYKGDSILINRRHRLTLDSMCRIKEFAFTNAENIGQTIKFSHTDDGCNLISFADGTTVIQSNDGMMVAHNGITLTPDNRDEFALTYSFPQTSPVVQTAVNNYCH